MFEFRQILATYEGKLIVTLAIILGLWALRSIVLHFINRKRKDIHSKIVNQQLSSYLGVILAISLIIPLWLHWFQSVFAVVSVIAVAVVLVTRDLLVNVLAHAVIIWRGLFSVGDRIQIMDYVGNVVIIGPMYLTLAEVGSTENHGHPTGRIIKLPNGMVLTTPVINYSRGIAIIWSEVQIEVEPGCNWQKARDIIQQAGDRHSATVSQGDVESMLIAVEEALSIQSAPSIDVKLEHGVIVLRLRFAYRIESKHETERKIWEEIIVRLAAEEDITLVRN